ncbi:MAG TPA: alpha/beta fold hydrolase [Alphaproteobacteria bacterium]|nr:alpha/beta fold hydrolase [Alphaproteobacteria bacterium]
MATFVVAHGAWSAGWAWKKMHPLMAAAGHRLCTPSCTGIGEREHLASPAINLDTHIMDVFNVLRFEGIFDAILIGHSYGGMVATGVADRARDRIQRLIYLDAFIPESGQSLLDLTTQRHKEMAVDGWRVPPNPLPSDTPEEDVTWATARRVYQPLGTLEQPVKLTHGPLTVPRHYILCTRGDAFRPFADKAHEAGWPVHEIDSSHSPHITCPAVLTELLNDIATDA